MDAAGRLILTAQFDKLRALEQAVREPHHHKAIHDMRVACRRMNSAFRLLRAYLPKKRVKPLLPFLENLRDTLGEIRNLDVLRADLEEFRSTDASHAPDALDGLHKEWSAARARHLDTLNALLDSAAYAQWADAMRAFLQEPAQVSSARVADVLPGLLWKQYGAVRAYETRLDDAVHVLHALRIDVKRLRYTLEFFRAPLTPAQDADAGPVALIETLITLQDCLGTMQDAVVGAHAVTAFMSAQLERPRAALHDYHALLAYHAALERRIEMQRAQLPPLYAVVAGLAFRTQLGSITARL